MKIRIAGVANDNPLLVKKTTRALIELQRQTGWDLSKLTEGEQGAVSAASAAFFAMHNAGLNPQWEELLDRDLDDFDIVPEPGDKKVGATAEADASDPHSSPAGSDPGGESVAAEPPAAGTTA